MLCLILLAVLSVLAGGLGENLFFLKYVKILDSRKKIFPLIPPPLLIFDLTYELIKDGQPVRNLKGTKNYEIEGDLKATIYNKNPQNAATKYDPKDPNQKSVESVSTGIVISNNNQANTITYNEYRTVIEVPTHIIDPEGKSHPIWAGGKYKIRNANNVDINIENLKTSITSQKSDLFPQNISPGRQAVKYDKIILEGSGKIFSGRDLEYTINGNIDRTIYNNKNRRTAGSIISARVSFEVNGIEGVWYGDEIMSQLIGSNSNRLEKEIIIKEYSLAKINVSQTKIMFYWGVL